MAAAFVLISLTAGPAVGQAENPPKAASEQTQKVLRQARSQLPFNDQQDFLEQRRGFVASPDFSEIRAADGSLVWSMQQYDFVHDDDAAQAVHPSLLRQARLNTAFGLYQVTERIYQVRGFDLSNITFIQSDNGWIVMDPLLSQETASAALRFINSQLGQRPVVAVIYSHSHADHFGGVRGVVNQAEVDSGRVQIIAPDGFMHHAIAENVYAGNAMNRRAAYQYGLFLTPGPTGHVDQAIGKTISRGTVTLIAPTRLIREPIEELTIDGVKMVFQNTPGTEAPAEMNTWFPDSQAFWAAENITATIHNIYTLRGALVRDALQWSKSINEALYLFGVKATVMFSSHNWPRWGNQRITQVMRDQRDMYAHMNNQTLHLANSGVTINQIHNEYQVPASQQRNWYSRGYHGSFEHNVRGVLNRYLGYWDANPATLIPLSPEQSAPLYVSAMGGASKIMELALTEFDQGRYRHAQELLNHLVQAQPGHKPARNLLADTFEQLGYQQESPSLRNSFLAGAAELRDGPPDGAGASTLGPDLVRAMSTGRFLDLLGIRLDARKAEGLNFSINLQTPDNGERFVLELNNAALTNIEGYSDPNADLTISVNRPDLNQYIMGQKTFAELVQSGQAKLSGNPEVLQTLQSLLTAFDPAFPIMPALP